MRPVYTTAAALLIPAIFSSGCASLQTSASQEGTGIQVVGAIVVLAKYQASQRQKETAEARARQAFVERALRPAYVAKTKKLKAIANSSPRRPPTPAGGKPAAPDRAALARAELATLSAAWQSTAASYSGGGSYASDFSVPKLEEDATAAVNFPKLSESDVLVASAAFVPRYLAVSVPSDRAVPGARETVMLWDTRAHQLASDTVYALDRTPPTNKPSRIDGREVQFDAPGE
ncbi:MAG: hypothetical protein ACKV19_19960 [Verrucomicrobiales bacterium]